MSIYMDQNGTMGETLCTDHTGYFYTIGRPNGLGKIHQPGTRGRIIDDGKPFRPAFTFHSNSSGDIVVRYPTDGYGAAWAEGTSLQSMTLRKQSYVNNDYYGMGDIIKETCLEDPNYLFVMPVPVTGTTYERDSSRYGDKPINGTFDLWNDNSLRGLITPSNTTIYKWEVHTVIVKYWRYNGIQGHHIDSSVLRAYVPYYYNNQWYNVQLERAHVYRTPSSKPGGIEYIYFRKEFSVNLYSRTNIFYPVFWMVPYDFSADPTPYYTVQTKFCFKAD